METDALRPAASAPCHSPTDRARTARPGRRHHSAVAPPGAPQHAEREPRPALCSATDLAAPCSDVSDQLLAFRRDTDGPTGASVPAVHAGAQLSRTEGQQAPMRYGVDQGPAPQGAQTRSGTRARCSGCPADPREILSQQPRSTLEQGDVSPWALSTADEAMRAARQSSYSLRGKLSEGVNRPPSPWTPNDSGRSSGVVMPGRQR